MKLEDTSRVRFTLAQTASRLKLPVPRVRQLIDGPLDAIRVGRRIFVELSALERFEARAG